MLEAPAQREIDSNPAPVVVPLAPAPSRRFIVLSGTSTSSGDVYGLSGALTLDPSGELQGSILWTVEAARGWPCGMSGHEEVVGHATLSGLCFTGVAISNRCFTKESYELAVVSANNTSGWFFGRSDAWGRGIYDARLKGTYAIREERS